MAKKEKFDESQFVDWGDRKYFCLSTEIMKSLKLRYSTNQMKNILQAWADYVLMDVQPEFKDEKSKIMWDRIESYCKSTSKKIRNNKTYQTKHFQPKPTVVEKKEYSSNEDEIDNLFDDSTSFEYTTITNKPEGGYFEKWDSIKEVR